RMPSNATAAEKCSSTEKCSSAGLTAPTRHQPRHRKPTIIEQERLGAMGQMARGIAHDINNSLTPIIGYADFILETQPGLSDDLRKYLSCIRAAAGDIASRVEQVRQFYRSREKHEVLQLIDLHSAVGEVLDWVKPRCQESTASNGSL